MNTKPVNILISFYGYEGYSAIPINWNIPFLPSVGDNVSINSFPADVNKADMPLGFSQGVVRRIVWTRMEEQIVPILYLSVQ